MNHHKRVVRDTNTGQEIGPSTQNTSIAASMTLGDKYNTVGEI